MNLDCINCYITLWNTKCFRRHGYKVEICNSYKIKEIIYNTQPINSKQKFPSALSTDQKLDYFTERYCIQRTV